MKTEEAAEDKEEEVHTREWREGRWQARVQMRRRNEDNMSKAEGP